MAGGPVRQPYAYLVPSPHNGTKVTDTDYYSLQNVYTDKKENQIFLIYKEIQNGAVAKSYMTNGLLIYG
jgi:hypothetical protein